MGFNDFSAMTPAEIDSFVVAHQDEIGAEGIEPGEVQKALASGRARMQLRPYGFALIERASGFPEGVFVPHLWVIYVDPEQRRMKMGRRFLRELLDSYDHHMSLYCHGAQRREFFGRLGFRVESRDGEWRRMTTNPDR